jgi:hypothetical protein
MNHLTSHFTKTLSALPLLLLASFWIPGCADSPESCTGAACGGGGAAGSGGQGGGGQGGAPEGSCVPSENTAGEKVPASCGVFVANAGGGDGTQEAPYGTIAEGLGDAVAGDRIYLCDEAFTESVVVPSGVTIYGGLNCKDGWTYEAGAQTRIAGVTNMPVLRFADGGETTTVHDVRVTAADATDDGGSSIGAIVEGGTVHLSRVEVIAGAGAAGATGATPTDDIGPSDPDDAAIKGNAPEGTVASCGGVIPYGGEEKANPFCTESVGGHGGLGEVAGTESNWPGGDGEVNGGAGGDDSGTVPGTCSLAGCCQSNGSGAAGYPGSGGTPGEGAMDMGVLTSEGWDGGTGADGERGGHGSGGGGGAGALVVAGEACAAGGNGGGVGGCGGFGGLGGQAGGGSFAVIVLDGVLSTTAGALTTSAGGAGGDGGLGQAGAIGGNPGSGGVCAGGKGGQGGDGGQGGGGRGGHSIAIAHAAAATINFGAETSISLGEPGVGGVGEGMDGTGAAGIASQIEEMAAE